ncbi:hypothetical protein [uncultured Fusobacterium sp.]|uniref:hypothetical protein n=1 Tax=uncultured Fusobacterium sp. TaxID=159267 RepID=UPI0025FCFE6E|nr:hypothetical protein [uncultured Fusobacterium sp.]
MKYTIYGYSQEKLNNQGIDLESALILRVIADLYTSNSKKIEYKIMENDKYMWCTYGYIHEQIPIIGAERTMIRKIDSLIDKGVLKKMVLKEKNGKKGNYLFITLGENYSDLTEYSTDEETKDVDRGTDKMSSPLVTKCHEGSDKMSSPLVTKCHNKDSSITNSSIKDSLEREKEADPFTQSGTYYQEIRMLLASYSINYEKIARLGKPISRIKEVLRIAKENGKSEGWIVGALTDDYNLEYFYKPREIKKEAAKKKSGKVINSSEYEDFSEDYFEKYIGKGEEIA